MEVNLQDVMTIINTVGFPIFVAIIMMWLFYKMTISHKEEMRMMSDAIDNNTLAMSQIKTQLEAFMQTLMKERQHD